MQKKVNKLIFWIPRILSILLISYMVLFPLMLLASHLIGLRFFSIILIILLINIPSIILIIILIISWKYELVGAITFILAGLLYIVLNLITIFRIGFEYQYIISFLLIGFPALLIGILFLIGWFKEIK